MRLYICFTFLGILPELEHIFCAVSGHIHTEQMIIDEIRIKVSPIVPF